MNDEGHSFFEVTSDWRRSPKLLITTNPSQKQYKILSTFRENEGLLYYQLVNSISPQYEVSASTERWNQNKRRDNDFVLAEDKDVNGVLVQLTDSGRLIGSLCEESKISR